MISKEQLSTIARKTGLQLYQQEKDYLLKLFLYLYYKRYDHALFKGGTCLRYLFGLNRFSEDLDFNIKDVKKFQQQTRNTVKEIELLGIKSYFIKEEIFADAYTCEIGFQGPLYNGADQTRNKFRIDAGYRTGTIKKPEWKIMKSEYPETEENFLILAMAFEEIFVEKLLAMMYRTKGRDLYDLWFLMEAGIALDKQLLDTKAQKQKSKIDLTRLPSKDVYERDMSRLTTKVIPYEQIKRAIKALFEKK